MHGSEEHAGGRAGRPEESRRAGTLLVEGYSGLKARAATIPPAAKTRVAEAIRRLVDLYTAWDKPAEAAKWQKKLDELNDDDSNKLNERRN